MDKSLHSTYDEAQLALVKVNKASLDAFKANPKAGLVTYRLVTEVNDANQPVYRIMPL